MFEFAMVASRSIECGRDGLRQDSLGAAEVNNDMGKKKGDDHWRRNPGLGLARRLGGIETWSPGCKILFWLLTPKVLIEEQRGSNFLGSLTGNTWNPCCMITWMRLIPPATTRASAESSCACAPLATGWAKLEEIRAHLITFHAEAESPASAYLRL